MRFALVSDIHGNLAALESVVASIAKKNIHRIYNLGDSIYGPLWPNETADYLRKSDIKSIIGNGDFDILNNRNTNVTMKNNFRELSDLNKSWIQKLPSLLIEDPLTIFHGTADSMYEYFFEYIQDGIVKTYEMEELLKKTSKIQTKYIGCGHSHIERIMTIHNQILLNPGSVGLPAYSDDKPQHKMETWNNRAKYIEVNENEIAINYVEYDYRQAAKQARKNNREDWAFSIETGRAK
jgi:predicted phosphodiesterase